MAQSNQSNSTSGSRLIFILTVGVFGIINTEIGVVGILPLIAQTFGVTVPQAGWTVGVFALVVALSAPVLPLLFSGFDRKKVMLLALAMFTLSNIVSMLTTDFTVLLIARALPAFLHPVYVSMAFTVAASSVRPEDAPKAVSRVFIGVSAGMVLGVPVTSFIASHSSFPMAMLFFATVTALVFAATLFCIPSMPVARRLSYGSQLRVLKRTSVWQAILAVTLINGAMFGFFSFMSDYLKTVTAVNYNTISTMLLIYGLANIAGNLLAGRLLPLNARRWVTITPLALFAVYLLLFVWGGNMLAMGVVILLLGVLAGLESNGIQYMIIDSAPEAPDFANGLFLTSANLGTTVGTAVCGAFITAWGTRYSVMGAFLFLAAGILFTLLRYRTNTKNNEL